MKLEINAKHLNALLANAADSKDVRYYLRGFCVDAANLRAMSTQGHALLVVPMMVEDAPDTPEQIIYQSIKPMGKTIVRVEIDTDTDRMIAYAGNGKQSHFALVRIEDAKFPDIDKILIKDEDIHSPVAGEICFNPALVADISKALYVGETASKCAVLFEFQEGSEHPLRAKFYEQPDVQCTIMPCRWS